MRVICSAAGVEVRALAGSVEPWACWISPAGRYFPCRPCHLLGFGGRGRWEVVCVGGFGCAESCANVPGRCVPEFVICWASAAEVAERALAGEPSAELKCLDSAD